MCVFFCNVFFCSQFSLCFVTYNSTNLQGFFSHFPTWQIVTQKNNSWVHDFACFYWFHSLLRYCSFSLSLAFCFFVYWKPIRYRLLRFFFRYWRHCRKTFVMFHAEENNRGWWEAAGKAGNWTEAVGKRALKVLFSFCSIRLWFCVCMCVCVNRGVKIKQKQNSFQKFSSGTRGRWPCRRLLRCRPSGGGDGRAGGGGGGAAAVVDAGPSTGTRPPPASGWTVGHHWTGPRGERLLRWNGVWCPYL